MKSKGLLLCALLMVVVAAFAQAQPGEALPQFKIARTDKTYFSNKNLVKGKPLVLVYFQPDCEDCHNFTTAMLKDAALVKNNQVLMVTNTSLSPVTEFEKTFGLKKYKNIVVGTEGYTTVLQRHFNVWRFPFIAVYGPDRRLKRTFQGVEAGELIKQINIALR